MAKTALAREELLALRREIAKIEGSLVERLELPQSRRGDQPVPEQSVLVRRGGIANGGLLPIGVEVLDGPLGGGLPRAALTEIHGAHMRDAGAVTGFALAMAALALKDADSAAPLLWIAAGSMISEAGELYAPGITRRYGLAPGRLILSHPKRIEDALWVAEEAAALAALSLVVLEIGGSPRKLDLTATRRLHRRAQIAGRPLFLLRHASHAEPTAAPVRLDIAAAPAGERTLLSGTLAGSIGPPAVTVTITRSRTHMPASATLEWSEDACTWRHRKIAVLGRAPDSGAVDALSADGQDIAPALGTVVALDSGGERAA